MTVNLYDFYCSDIRRDLRLKFDISSDVIPGSVEFEGSISSAAGLVKFSGKAGFTIKTECARCLEPIERKESIDIEHYLVKTDCGDDDDLYIPVEGGVFNPEELICEDISLSLPYRFLCREDCKGLCPKCGKNLNLGPCGCPADIDPRLEKLQSLLTDEE